MIETLETGIPSKIMIYGTNDEKAFLKRLFHRKEPNAHYYDKKGKLEALHWLLYPTTVKKLGLLPRLQIIPAE